VIQFWCKGYVYNLVRSFIASEYSSFVRVVDCADDAFSLIKFYCSHFCLTTFNQPFPGTIFKLRTSRYLAKNMKEMLSTKTDSNFTAQTMPRDTLSLSCKWGHKSQVHCLKIKETQPNRGEKKNGFFIERFHMTSQQSYWCSETMKWRPCWSTKLILLEFNSFLRPRPHYPR